MIKDIECRRRQFLTLAAAGVSGATTIPSSLVGKETRADYVSLGEAHRGTPEIDLRIMNQFGVQPQEVQDFYLACRKALTGKNPERALIEVCRKADRWKLGGPMLGDVTSASVSVWMHLPQPIAVHVTITPEASGVQKTFQLDAAERIFSVRCDGLQSGTAYTYQVTDSRNNDLAWRCF